MHLYMSFNIVSIILLQVKYILDRDVGAAKELATKLKVSPAIVGKPNEWDTVCQDDR